jgi:hypothetical protein
VLSGEPSYSSFLRQLSYSKIIRRFHVHRNSVLQMKTPTKNSQHIAILDKMRGNAAVTVLVCHIDAKILTNIIDPSYAPLAVFLSLAGLWSPGRARNACFADFRFQFSQRLGFDAYIL